jgi:hypothetical protein
MNKINDTFFNILEEQNVLKTTKTKPIVDAIKNRNPITFYYSGPRKPKKDSVKPGKRINAEAVALGLSKKGNLIVRAWVQPPSTSKKGFNKHGWRTFMLSRMSNVEIDNKKTFDIPRDKFTGSDKDGSMTVTYVSSVFGSKVKPPKKQKEPNAPSIEPIVKEPMVKPSEPAISGKPTPEIKPEKPISTVEPAISGNEKPSPKPMVKPEVKPTTPEVTPTEPKPEVQATEPTPEELPQPKPKNKPSKNPEEDENEKLNESIRKIKSLMF